MHFTPRALIICLALALFTFQIGCPPATWAEVHQSKIEPQIMGTPEEDIAPAAAKGKKSNKMVWIGVIAGVVVLGGLAALVGGGGSGDDPEPTTTGSISIGW